MFTDEDIDIEMEEISYGFLIVVLSVMKMRGMTKEEVSEKIGIPMQNIDDLMVLENCNNFKIMSKIALALDFSWHFDAFVDNN